MYETIKTQIKGRVAIINFDRPKKLNALNQMVMREVLAAAKSFVEDPQIGCLILQGNERAFAAGADISELEAQDYSSMQKQDYFHEWDEFAELSIPKIAAVDGYALGGGCEVAMMCDIIIASENAKFGQPEIKIGSIPGMGGTQRLTRLIGRACAMDMILTGRMIDAGEALRLGLVSRVVQPEHLEAAVLEIASEIAGFADDIIQMARDAVNQAEETSLSAGIKYERRTYHALYGLPSQREGMEAFLQKRTPVFNE